MCKIYEQKSFLNGECSKISFCFYNFKKGTKWVARIEKRRLLTGGMKKSALHSPTFGATNKKNIMKVTLQRVNDAVRFEGSNSAGNRVIVEGSPEIGGEGQGMRPMELLLASLASCSSMDTVSILKKMRQPLEDLRIEVEGHRDTQQVPAVFTKIHLHFILKGDLRPEKVEEAIRLSVKKYCSVGRMLEKTAEITYDWELMMNDE